MPQRELLYPIADLAIPSIIQVDQGLAMANHQLYRQTRSYRIKVDLNRVDNSDEVQVYTLSDTWMLRQAIKHAKAHYDASRAEEVKNVGKKARWNDFRIIHGAGVVTWNLLRTPTQYTWTIGSGGPTQVPLVAGEYLYSSSATASGALKGYSIGGVGPYTTTVNAPFATAWNILAEYSASRDTQADPEDVTANVMFSDSELMEEMGVNSVELDEVLDDGNLPPYDPDNLTEGSPWVQNPTVGGTGTQSTRVTTGYIDAPLGLVLIFGNGAGNVLISCAKGDYKGVQAENLLG